MSQRALVGAEIFDGTRTYSDAALLLDDETFQGIVADTDVPDQFTIVTLPGGTVMPGFVDLQVNGGGGVMFNDETSVTGLQAIAAAHASTGTRSFLPTLITDTPEKTRAAVEAVEKALLNEVPGIVGLHLEGPHLSVARKGAHDPQLIRPMQDADEEFLCEASKRLPNLMVTVAPESVSLDQIEKLSKAGIVISLGHSDCSFADAKRAFEAGAKCVTHLFNAMSQINNREPGLVGAALDAPGIFAGLIADNIHVHASNMRTALSAKREPGAIFLVTDAMSTVGSDITSFTLNGRKVFRQNGQLTLENGTLAGADLIFSRALSVLVKDVGLSRERALSMATSIPARCLPTPESAGNFIEGCPARAILLDDDLCFVAAY